MRKDNRVGEINGVRETLFRWVVYENFSEAPSLNLRSQGDSGGGGGRIGTGEYSRKRKPHL